MSPVRKHSHRCGAVTDHLGKVMVLKRRKPHETWRSHDTVSRKADIAFSQISLIPFDATEVVATDVGTLIGVK